MGGRQLVFGRIAGEATGWDSGKMDRIARLLNPEKDGRRALERRFPATVRLLERLALAEMDVGGFEEDGVSDSLRIRAKAELGPKFRELARTALEETIAAGKADRRSNLLAEACRMGAVGGIGFPASSLLVFSFFNMQPGGAGLIALGVSAAIGAAMGWAAHRMERAKAARREFEETVGMLAAHVRGFLEGRVREFADDE